MSEPLDPLWVFVGLIAGMLAVVLWSILSEAWDRRPRSSTRVPTSWPRTLPPPPPMRPRRNLVEGGSNTFFMSELSSVGPPPTKLRDTRCMCGGRWYERHGMMPACIECGETMTPARVVMPRTVPDKEVRDVVGEAQGDPTGTVTLNVQGAMFPHEDAERLAQQVSDLVDEAKKPPSGPGVVEAEPGTGWQHIPGSEEYAKDVADRIMAREYSLAPHWQSDGSDVPTASQVMASRQVGKTAAMDRGTQPSPYARWTGTHWACVSCDMPWTGDHAPGCLAVPGRPRS